ncbi:MAG TPA: glycosyltransferase family 2 protein, partial [Gammaproteobacteria bacterium]|nr:glycosyltransferase family 2 protein [Gammaproteobacteria bacterium]
ARASGADHVIRHRRNRGLAAAFQTGIDASLRLGADIIVNTDADNQYEARDIPALLGPILDGEADFVVGDRKPGSLRHFSRTKRILQRLGTRSVVLLSGVEIGDAVSGFRALSREAALRLNVVSDFSYTIETLIQAGRARMAVASVDIRSRPTERTSRLFASIPRFLERSLGTMLRVYTMYHPLRVFLSIGFGLAVIGVMPIGRFVWYYLQGEGAGKVQSLLLGSVLLLMGFAAVLIGIVADLISFNRRLIEMGLERIRRLEAAGEPSGFRSGQDSSPRRTDPLPPAVPPAPGEE